MDREVELAGLASLGAWLKRKPAHVAPVGAPCANCGEVLQGPFCHRCGQLAEDFHRSFRHLVEETLENLLHLDGRMWRTLPRLALKPAELTRDYLEDRRAFQIPPLRLFLVVVLAFFFVGGLTERLGHEDVRFHFATPNDPTLTAGQREAINEWQRAVRGNSVALGAVKWLEPRFLYAGSHQAEFKLIFDSWAHRFAILLLPVSALLLGVLFVFQRKFYVYDHLIFSMHSLSFMGALLSVKGLVEVIPIVGGASGLLYLVMPAHLFAHMRGVYRTSVPGALIRMALLGAATLVAVVLGFVAMVAIDIAGMPSA